jgi:hypothetical protein
MDVSVRPGLERIENNAAPSVIGRTRTFTTGDGAVR